MAKLTAEERAELEAKLAADDDDDESDEVTVTKPDGSSFTGSYRRAKRLGLVTEPPKDEGDSAANSDAKVKRFQSGRRVG